MYPFARIADPTRIVDPTRHSIITHSFDDSPGAGEWVAAWGREAAAAAGGGWAAAAAEAAARGWAGAVGACVVVCDALSDGDKIRHWVARCVGD